MPDPQMIRFTPVVSTHQVNVANIHSLEQISGELTRLYASYQSMFNRTDFPFGEADVQRMSVDEIMETGAKVFDNFIELRKRMYADMLKLQARQQQLLPVAFSQGRQAIRTHGNYGLFGKTLELKKNQDFQFRRLADLIVSHDLRLKKRYSVLHALKNQQLARNGELVPSQKNRDILFLRNGRSIQGTVLTQTVDSVTIRTSDDKEITLPKNQVRRIALNQKTEIVRVRQSEAEEKPEEFREQPAGEVNKRRGHYYDYSLEEYLDYEKSLARTCPASELPDLLIESCYKTYVTLNLTSQERVDLYFFLKLLTHNSEDQLRAIWYAEENADKRFRALRELLEKQLGDPHLGIDVVRKQRIRLALQKMEAAEKTVRQ